LQLLNPINVDFDVWTFRFIPKRFQFVAETHFIRGSAVQRKGDSADPDTIPTQARGLSPSNSEWRLD